MYTYAVGKMVAVTAIPATGWSFQNWLVNGKHSGNGSRLSFVMNADINIMPVFRVVPTVVPALVILLASVSFSSKGIASSVITVDGTAYALPASFSWAIGSVHTASVQRVIPVGTDT
jgi:hypothetical protein